MMKKMLFLMLFLMFLGIANVSSQVRIGGNEKPNDAAVLDLNADNNTNTGTKGLVLPRVSLSDKNAKLDGVTANIKGILVYNTGGSLAEGVYYWNGATWVYTLDSYLLGGDSLMALDSAKPGDVLQYNGTGWRTSPGQELVVFTVTCTACSTLNATGNYANVQTSPPARCSTTNMWISQSRYTSGWTTEIRSTAVHFYRNNTTQPNTTPEVYVLCLRSTS